MIGMTDMHCHIVPGVDDGASEKEVKELLIKHGADKLSEINPAEYEALLAEVEVLGNG